MPGILKHVHFAEDIEFHSAPQTPSPSYSVSSLPSSVGPCTPPSATAALPSHGQAHVHGVLAFRPNTPSTVAYDVSEHPSTIALNPALRGSTFKLRTVLSEPATNPPMPALTILSDLLPYPIPVHAGAVASAASPYTPPTVPLPMPGSVAPARAPPCVTVADVLNAVYAFLRTPLMRAEFLALPPARQQSVSTAFAARVARVLDPRARAAEQQKGVKRIDLLIATGRTRFLGLSATKRAPHAWVLNLG